MKICKTISVGLFLVLLCFSIYFPLSAGAPTDLMRTTVDKVVAVLKNPRLQSDARKKERRDQLRQVIYPRFDFAAMAKRSLGSHWRSLTPEEQREFEEVFTDLLESSYVDQIESYNDEKILYIREIQDDNYAEVSTKIATSKGEEFSINYKLHLVNQSWKVYDIVIENISLINNYRSQFNRIIMKSSYKELLRRMKEKQFEVMRKKKNMESS